MPYKSKEDRAAAVRRHREKQRRERQTVEKLAKIDASLGNVLKLLGFQEVSYEDMVEACRHDEKDDAGVWYDRKRDRVIYPPEHVYFGLNTLIAGDHLDDQVSALAMLFRAMLDYAEDSED